MKKLPIAGVAVAVAITFAPFGPVAQAGDPCDILSNSPSGYASCKADEANVPGFRERLQQQQQGEIGNCADETEAATQKCLQARGPQIAQNTPPTPPDPWGDYAPGWRHGPIPYTPHPGPPPAGPPPVG